MIKLELESYCENCPFFDSDIKRFYSMDEKHTTLIYCIHKKRCEDYNKRLAEIEIFSPKEKEL